MLAVGIYDNGLFTFSVSTLTFVWVSEFPLFTGVTFRFSTTTNTTQILQARKQMEYDNERASRNKQFNNHNKQDKND